MSKCPWFPRLMGTWIVLAQAGLVSAQDAPAQKKARDTEIAASLEKAIPFKFEKASLKAVLKAITIATKTSTTDGLVFVLDPDSLKAAGVTVDTPVTYATEDGEALLTTLSYVLGMNKLRYEVKEGAIHIRVRAVADGIAVRDDRIQTRIRAKLQEPIPLHFKDTPFEDVLKFIKKSSQGPNDNGIPIYIDPVGLQKAKVTIDLPVSFDTNPNETLESSLKRLLKSLGLAFTVKNGLLMITSEGSLDEDLPEAKSRDISKPTTDKPE